MWDCSGGSVRRGGGPSRICSTHSWGTRLVEDARERSARKHRSQGAKDLTLSLLVDAAEVPD